MELHSDMTFNGQGEKLRGSCPLKVIERLPNNVYVADCKQNGIHLAGLTTRGFHRPFAFGHTELFCDGEPYRLSRYPKEQYLTIQGYGESHDVSKDDVQDVGKLDKGFFYADAEPSTWKHTNNLYLFGYWAYDWACTYEQIDQMDPEKGFLLTAAPFGMYYFRKGQRFCFVNVLDALSPGEYALDLEEEKIYFMPREEDDLKRLTASHTLNGLLLENLENVVIEGYDIGEYLGHGILVRNCRNITIRNCRIHHVGGNAVRVENSWNVLIENCEICHTGEGGIHFESGDREALLHGDSGVRNCHIHDVAEWAVVYAPGIYLGGCGLFAEKNCIHDAPHTAILYEGNDMRIVENVIYDVLHQTDDAGAIYSGRNPTFRGNVISGNLLFRTGGYKSYTSGIYNDDVLSGTTITNNVFYNINNAILCGGGRDMLIRSNTFINCKPAIRIDNRGVSQTEQWRGCMEQIRTMFRNVFDDPTKAERFLSAYPELQKWQDYFASEELPFIRAEGVIAENIYCGSFVEVSDWCDTAHEYNIFDNLQQKETGVIEKIPQHYRDVLAAENEL